jgi:hypothetical protein
MKSINSRQAVLLIVLFVALSALIRTQMPSLNKPTSRIEAKLETDADGLPIVAALKGPEFGDDDLLRVVGIPWLQRIVLADSRITGRSLKGLGQLTKLNSLDLSSTVLTDDDFQPITQLTALTELMLSGCPWFTDKHLARLSELNQLQRLEFSSQQITNQGLQLLGQFPELKTLVIGDCFDFGDDEIETFKNLPRLRAITLTGANLSSPTVFALRSKLPHVEVKVDLIALKDLKVLAGKGRLSADAKSFHAADSRSQFEPLVPGDMAVISNIGPLEFLALKGPITDEMFQEMKPMPNLGLLQVLDSHITDEGLEHLVHFPKLKSFSMFPTRLTGRGLVHLRHTPQLERLEIRTSLGDEVLEHLAPLTELNELIINAPITDAGLERLPLLPKLRSLWLNDPSVTGPGIAHLTKQPELVALSLGSSTVDDRAIDAVANLPQLKSVYLRLTRISVEGKARLKELRPDISIQ